MMKTTLTRRLFPILLLLVGALLPACQKVEVLAEDISIYLDTDLLAAPVAVQIVDANLANPNPPLDISVRIFGPDADKVYSVLGEKNIRATGNVVTFGIKKSEPVSAASPLRFSVVAEAPGYMPAVVSVVVTDLHDFQLLTAGLINPDSPPKGVSVIRASFATGAAGLPDKVSLSTPVPANKREKADVVIPKGTRFFDSDGLELQGTVEAVLIHYDNRQRESLEAFPGGWVWDNSLDTEGEELGESTFISTGFISMEMKVGNKPVKSFSEPVEATLTVNREMVNPSTGTPIKPGDAIPVWSFDTGRGLWRQEARSRVEQRENALVATVMLEHLSFWNWAWRRQWCVSSVQFRTQIEPGEGGQPYYVVLHRAFRSGGVYWEWPADARYSLLNDGEELLFRSLRTETPNEAYRVRVYETFADFLLRQPLVESDFFDVLCGATTVDFSDELSPDFNTITLHLDINARCERDLIIRPTSSLYVRESADPYGPFTAFVPLESGRATTKLLKRNVTYDLSLSYGSIQRRFNNITIPTKTSTIEVDQSEEGFTDLLEFEFLDEENVLLKIRDMELPAEVCAEWWEIFGE